MSRSGCATMKDNEIKFVEISENEDGYATVKIIIKPDTYSSIFEYGFITLLKKSIKNVDNFWE